MFGYEKPSQTLDVFRINTKDIKLKFPRVLYL